MNTEQFEQQTGWRGVFHALPHTKNMALKTIMPLGFFYSPFLAIPNEIKLGCPICTKCKGALNPFCSRNRQTKTWSCNFCNSVNCLSAQIGNSAVEQYVQGKVGDNGVFFIVDLCISQQQLTALKQTLSNTIKKLPRNIFVGLITFNRNVFIHQLSSDNCKVVAFNGQQDYSAQNFIRLKQTLGLISTVDPRHTKKVILKQYYLPIVQCEENLLNAIQQLSADSHHVPRQLRQKRCTGCAFQIAIGLVHDIGISTRFVATIGGPCTIGLGKVVDLPLKKTIRSFIDILQGNQNTEYIKTATTFYQSLQKLLITEKCTMDIWAYGLDQFGLMEMKSLVNNTGGLLAMQQMFNYYIFQNSFQKFYEANEDGRFKFPIACTLTIRVPKQLSINGLVGLGKSLKQNTLKTASEMQIGEGGTNIWYLGGISQNNAQCIILTHSQLTVSENKQRSAVIQAITSYKYSDNMMRTRVSTINLDFLRESQTIQLIKRFDEQAASVMLARIATKKAQIQDITEVKKWLDRILLKFCVKFSHYQRMDPTSFKLPHMMKHFPQFMYHLRRSNFINPFGAPPDQSLYTKTCMLRQAIANCIVMIQPALLRYSVEQPQPVPVELDLQQLKDEVVLLLDSFFIVLVWFGESVQGWKQQKLNQTEEYQYLNDLFKIPLEDASQIIYDRVPCSNFYETHKNDGKGKERYLKSRINPSKSENDSGDGHFVSDDAPIKLFMQFLIKSVVSYNE